MAVLKQSSSSFQKYLVWCGVCEEDTSSAQYKFIESVNQFDIRVFEKSLSINSFSQILQIIEYTHSGTNVKIYDKSVPSEFIDFDSLRVGHLYYIILDKGTDQINLLLEPFYLDTKKIM